MQTYINTLLESGEMRIVEREVEGRFELAAVTARSQRESDRPILFKKVKGSALPVVSNIFGSRRRLYDLIGAKDGPYITAGIFLVKEPETGVPNLSFHRCMQVSDVELRVRLGTSHHLTRYQAKAEQANGALAGSGHPARRAARSCPGCRRADSLRRERAGGRGPAGKDAHTDAALPPY